MFEKLRQWYMGETSMFSHLNEKKMSYCEHMTESLTYTKDFAILVFKSSVHAFLPCLYTTASTDYIKRRMNDIPHDVICEFTPQRCIFEDYQDDAETRVSCNDEHLFDGVVPDNTSPTTTAARHLTRRYSITD
tara:strand:- start:6 stop:404 length:399 start_codon:yes stop_codon:yes gene_type:complete